MQRTPDPIRTARDLRFGVPVAAVLVLGAASVVGALGAESAAATIVGLCFGVALLAVGAVAVRTAAPAERLTDIDTAVVAGVRVTRLHYARGPYLLLLTVMACGAVFCAAITVVVWWHAHAAAPPGTAAAAFVVTAGFASYLVAVTRGSVQRGSVTLSPNGIHHRGWSFEAFAPWESVRGIHDRFGARTSVTVFVDAGSIEGRHTTWWIWRIDRLPRGDALDIPCSQFAMSHDRLHRVLAHYVENPDFRNEFGTVLSLSRARGV